MCQVNDFLDLAPFTWRGGIGGMGETQMISYKHLGLSHLIDELYVGNNQTIKRMVGVTPLVFSVLYWRLHYYRIYLARVTRSVITYYSNAKFCSLSYL